MCVGQSGISVVKGGAYAKIDLYNINFLYY